MCKCISLSWALFVIKQCRVKCLGRVHCYRLHGFRGWMLHGLLWFLSFIAFRTQVLPGPSNQTSGVTTAAAQPGDGGSQLPETAAVAGEARMLSRNISGFKWLQKAPTVGRCWCKCWCRCWYITAVGLVFLVFGSLWHRCFRRLLAHPREQGGDERDSGSEPKSETEDALRLEHSGGLPESKETASAYEKMIDFN